MAHDEAHSTVVKGVGRAAGPWRRACAKGEQPQKPRPKSGRMGIRHRIRPHVPPTLLKESLQAVPVSRGTGKIPDPVVSPPTPS